MEQISIELRRAKDDPPAHDPQFQEELRAFAQSLRTAGFAYSQRGAVGYSLPQFLVTFSSEVGATFAIIPGDLASEPIRARHPRDTR